ncbi:ATP-binding protein [Psychrobacter sp. FDAARGOS_221]|uniref:ATP-binding protein n=1 Tax=Psychrobacter sp. FDAARGOS_221 TaxID=1975705 RepID=UPI000BB57EA0|nr:ATP-binding protein [Psychrobacter sp. FDAARGOS_221]PNK59624.1 histidine kinase [Psychrobacter sp. FDAARGOS_221]
MKSIQKRLLTYLLIGLPTLWIMTSSVTTWKLWHEIDEMNDTQIIQMARYLIETARDDDLEGDYELKRYELKQSELEQTELSNENNADEIFKASESHHDDDEHEYDKHEEEDKDEHEDDDDDEYEEEDHHDSAFAKIYTLNSKPLPIEIEGNLGDAKEEYLGFAIWDKTGRLLMADHNGQSFDFLPDQHGFLEDHQSTYQRLNPFSKRWRLFYVHDEYANDNAGRVIAVGQNLESRRETITNAITVQLLPMFFGLFAFIGLVVWAVRQGFAPLTQISSELSQRDLSDNTPIKADVPKEVQALVNSLNALFVKVSQALEREQRFTADASHELRSPLTALKLQADLLKQQLLHYSDGSDASNETQLYDHAQKISDGIDRANHLVDQLLILAKLAPQQQLPEDQLELADWIALTDDVLSEVNRQAREKYIQLKRSVTVEAEQVLPLHINLTLMKILLRNVLDNAIRYSPENSTVEIVLAADSIVVKDNGKGVNQEHLNRLSERFYRPAGQKQKGSGLGLSIVHQIAQLHQLNVNFANRPAPDSGLIVTISKSSS